MNSSPYDSSSFIPFTGIINDREGYLHLIEELEGLKRFLFRDKAGPISVKAGGYISADLEKIFKEIEQRGLEPATDDKQNDFLNALIDYLEIIPFVKITLSFDPTAIFLSSINNKISLLANKKIILDVAVDRRIIGGLKIEYLGKFADYSVGKKVDLFLTSSKEQFIHD